MAETPPVALEVPSAEALFRETGGPDFVEPWQAQVFACAFHPQTPTETANAAYYRQWLAALETIVGLKGAASTAEISERQEAWREAYLKTPHGQPVELSHGVRPPVVKVYHHNDDHSNHEHRALKPVAVSPATSC